MTVTESSTESPNAATHEPTKAEGSGLAGVAVRWVGFGRLTTASRGIDKKPRPHSSAQPNAPHHSSHLTASSGAEALKSAPQPVSLAEVLRASNDLAADQNPTGPAERILRIGAASLGGIRPKISVRFKDGSPVVVKFPHGTDRWDVMAWEATTLDLLEILGVRVPRRRLAEVIGRNVLILRRFDRSDRGDPIPFAGALKMVTSEGEEPWDYADLVGSIEHFSLSPSHDLNQLFTRAIANVALGNTDDHLRNHGFLWSKDEGGWRLSPAFDVNPNPDSYERRETSIMGANGLPDEPEGLLALASEICLSQADARKRMLDVAVALEGWQWVAQTRNIDQREIAMMAESIDRRLEAIAVRARNGPTLRTS